MILTAPTLILTAYPAGSSSSSSGSTAYAKSYGVIVGADGIEYSHSSLGSYAAVVGFETWRADLGHGFVREAYAPADVLAIWRAQQAGSSTTTAVSPTSPPLTPQVITTPPAAAGTGIMLNDAFPAPTGVINVDRQAADAPVLSGGITAPSAGPLGNTLPVNTPQLTVAPSRINWWLVIASTLALGGLLWFFGGKRRKGDA